MYERPLATSRARRFVTAPLPIQASLPTLDALFADDEQGAPLRGSASARDAALLPMDLGWRRGWDSQLYSFPPLTAPTSLELMPAAPEDMTPEELEEALGLAPVPSDELLRGPPATAPFELPDEEEDLLAHASDPLDESLFRTLAAATAAAAASDPSPAAASGGPHGRRDDPALLDRRTREAAPEELGASEGASAVLRAAEGGALGARPALPGAILAGAGVRPT